MASDDRPRTDDDPDGAGEPERDHRPGGADEAAGGLRATVQASNAEAVLDPDAPPQDAEEEAADTVDRMERHNEPHDGAPPDPD
jgi:hypothetical protein